MVCTELADVASTSRGEDAERRGTWPRRDRDCPDRRGVKGRGRWGEKKKKENSDHSIGTGR